MAGIRFWSSEIVLATQITDGIREATWVALLLVLCGTDVEYSFSWFVWWLIVNPYTLHIVGIQ